MADDKKYMKISAVAVAIALISVAVAAYAVVTDNNADCETCGEEYESTVGEFDWHLGKYLIYDVTGSADGMMIDGTINMEVTEVEGSVLTITTTNNVHVTVDGERTPFIVGTETEELDMNENVFRGVWMHSEMFVTEWGLRITDVYMEVAGGMSVTYYVDRMNTNVAFKMVEEISFAGIEIIYMLNATNYFPDNEGEGEYGSHMGKYMIFEMSMSAGDVTFGGTVIMEVVKVEDSVLTFAVMYNLHYTFGDVTVPFMVMADIMLADMESQEIWGVPQPPEDIETNWGPKTVNVYTEATPGSSVTMFVDQENENVIYKMIITEDSLVFTFMLTATNYL